MEKMRKKTLPERSNANEPMNRLRLWTAINEGSGGGPVGWKAGSNLIADGPKERFRREAK
jgi:hypothetical protein